MENHVFTPSSPIGTGDVYRSLTLNFHFLLFSVLHFHLFFLFFLLFLLLMLLHGSWFSPGPVNCTGSVLSEATSLASVAPITHHHVMRDSDRPVCPPAKSFLGYGMTAQTYRCLRSRCFLSNSLRRQPHDRVFPDTKC